MTKRPSSTEVGYGKPPVATRFKRGQSGNSRGRPKGPLGLATLVQKSARERVIVQENGTRKRIPKSEAAIKQLFNLAMTGDQRALKLVTDLMKHHNIVPPPPEPKFTLTEADREVLTLMIARARHHDDGDHNAH